MTANHYPEAYTKTTSQTTTSHSPDWLRSSVNNRQWTSASTKILLRQRISTTGISTMIFLSQELPTPSAQRTHPTKKTTFNHRLWSALRMQSGLVLCFQNSVEQGTDTSKLQKKLQDIERYSTRMRIYNGTNILTKDVFPVNDASCLLCTPYVYNWNVVSICAKLIWYYLFIPVMYLYTVNLFSIIVFFNAPHAYNVCLFDCILFVIFVMHTVCYFCYAYCLLFLLLCKYILLTEVFTDVCLHFVFMISFLTCEKIK